MNPENHLPSAAPASLLAENRELSLLFEAVFQHCGHDFRNYARASIQRRVQARVQAEGLRWISELQSLILRDPAACERFLLGLTVHVTALFRDPAFYLAFRHEVLPWLRTHSFFRLWVAGCATGEEVYSLAILLHEADLTGRARVYATDWCETVIAKAKAGVWPLANMRAYTENYHQAGGQRDFSEYYTAGDDRAVMAAALRQNVLFAPHNLVTDASFNEFHVILCRNVMIYFNRALQARVHRLIFDSLAPQGFVCVGRSESLRFTPHEQDYAPLNAAERIYRRQP